MKRINTSKLIPGMITAEDVYNFNNQLIISKGITLDDKSIAKLDYYSIMSIRVEDEYAPTQGLVPLSDEETTYSARLKESPEFKEFKEKFTKDVETFRESVNGIITLNVPLDIDKLMDQSLNILNIGATTGNLLNMIHCMKEYDDATFVHCINVALICNVMARWLKMSDYEIRTATAAGLMHDIGKTQIPDSIIKKPGKLTKEEFRVIQRHPIEGYELLKNTGLDPEILNAILMHHEKCDGSGYPLRLDSSKIPTMAKIVAIADVYDAMTSARVYRGPLCPFKTIEIFEEEGLQKYDPKFIMCFLENVVNIYLLNDVLLSNGEKGKIVYINKNNLSSPTIKTKNGFIDLSTTPDVHIEEIL